MPDTNERPVRSEREIFLAALDYVTPEARAVFLDGACGGNQPLRRRVEALLAVHFEQEPFMRQPAAEPASTVLVSTPTTEVAATLIGRYRLLEKLGEGGFGTVWAAEQREPVKRRVALKIIKLGMDTGQVVARFEAERQALALMDHPNIAKVLDAGSTDTGRPYFVMELVRGIKLTDYCEQQHLTTRERLELFIKVCQAVQHAHQKGIIHRDLKPSNILVTLHDGVPVPKVIDFGIAKATQQELTEKTIYTQCHQFIGTPAYMSPEQAELSGLDIDTRSDIYSLGVLLYEVLTGSTPFDTQELLHSGLDEMRRVIREREPVRPSTRLSQTLLAVGVRRLRSTSGDRQSEEEIRASAGRLLRIKETIALLRGDLDWIVMRCLEKDRARRYDTANGLAMDIQRHLNDEPIVARPPSQLYRLRKMARRNKIAFTAVAAVAVAVIVGLMMAALGWREARTERDRAVRLSEDAERARVAEAAQRQKAEASERRTRQNLYVANVNLAHQAWEEGNLPRAVELLEASRPSGNQEDLRTFEWGYLRTLCQDESRLTLTNFPGGVTSVAFSPDGKALLLAGGTRLNRLDVNGWQERLLVQDPDGILRFTASPTKGDLLATVSGDSAVQKLKLWDLGTRQNLATFETVSAEIRAIAFSPDGRVLASVSSNHMIKLWDVEKRSEPAIRTFDHQTPRFDVVFSRDGKHVVTCGAEPAIRIWDIGSGRQMDAPLEGHTGYVYVLAFSPDGRWLASAGGDSTIVVWDFVARQQRAQLVGHTGRVYSLAFSADGRLLISGGVDRTVRIWELDTRQQISIRRGHTEPVNSVAVSAGAQFIVSKSIAGTAKLWDWASREEMQTLLGHQRWVDAVAFSPEGTMLASGDLSGVVRVWDVASQSETATLRGHAGSVWSASFSPDGKVLATGGDDQTVLLWDPLQGKRVASLPAGFPVWSLAFSPDGRALAAGGGGIKFWDASSREELKPLAGDTGKITCVAFSPEAPHLATGHDDGKLVLWNWRDRTPIRSFQPHSDRVVSVAFSYDGTWLASAGFDTEIALYDVAQAHLTEPPLKGHVYSIYRLAFTPDDRSLASASLDGTLKLWNLATRQVALTLRGHVGPVTDVSFSKDSTLMATSGADGRVRLWPAAVLETAGSTSRAFQQTPGRGTDAPSTRSKPKL